MSAIAKQPQALEIMRGQTSSTGNSVIYSDVIRMPFASVWNTHFDWTEVIATYSANVTLWSSGVAKPDESTDADWVQMEAEHKYEGLPGGDPVGGDGKDMVDVSAAGGLHYRWKISWLGGSATWLGKVSQKPGQ